MATRGRPDVIADAERRVEEAAAAAGIEVASADEDGLDLLVVLGGDGTMLRALRAKLGTGTAVFGINFGRVGFLTTAGGDQLDEALAHALSGDFRVVDLCSLEARLNGDTHAAVNDVVVTSSAPGRMVALGWEVGRRAPRRPALRRDDLLHALGLHGVQPLERRPRDDVGPGGDGDDLRGAALAPRAGRSSSRAGSTSASRTARRSYPSPSSSTATRSPTSSAATTSRWPSARSTAGSRSCPR